MNGAAQPVSLNTNHRLPTQSTRFRKPNTCGETKPGCRRAPTELAPGDVEAARAEHRSLASRRVVVSKTQTLWSPGA